MCPDPLTLDLFGTYPNAMFGKVPIFMRPNPLSADVYGTGTYLSLCNVPKGSFNRDVRRVLPIPDPLSTDVYGTYRTLPKGVVEKILPIFMHPDPPSTEIYGYGSILTRCSGYG